MFFSLLLVCLSALPAVLYAKDYDYGCPRRNPRYKPTVEELTDYIEQMDIIFEGKPLSRDPFFVGLLVTRFEVKKIIKGEDLEQTTIDIVHTKDMFTELDATYFVRAWRAKDNNLYPEGMSCPKYYTDQEILDYYRYYWHKFFLGLFILLLGVFAAYKYFSRDNELTRKLTWLRR
ncbi:MAG: hypothetical protein KJ017_04485 [Alphaproteobacteria bacterium]|nr:hypothetical protein [Alphaproteobacteria bacterium]